MLGYHPTGQLGTARHPVAHDALRGAHLENRKLVAREAPAQVAEHPCKPRPVTERAVDPNVLARAHRDLLRDLLQEGALAMAHVAGLRRRVRALHVGCPLGHELLEVVGIDVHDVLEREVSNLGHPRDHVPLACPHRSTRVHDPRIRHRRCPIDHRVDRAVLPLLPLLGVVGVVRVVDTGANARIRPVELTMEHAVVVVRRPVEVVLIGDGEALVGGRELRNDAPEQSDVAHAFLKLVVAHHRSSYARGRQRRRGKWWLVAGAFLR